MLASSTPKPNNMKQLYPLSTHAFKPCLHKAFFSSLLLLVGIGTQAQTPCTASNFTPVATYASGGNSLIASATADFNGDGVSDLVLANNFTPNLGVLLGKGDGSFGALATYSTGSRQSCLWVTVGDFNGDAKIDILVSLGGGEGLGVLLGKGDGSFAPIETRPNNNPYVSLATGDFNKDGKLDVVATSGTVDVFIGNGDGTFQNTVAYPGGLDPVSVAVGNFDNDGNDDLAVTSSVGQEILVFKGNGDGSFNEPVSYASGGDHPSSVAIGNFNNDTYQDLAVANSGSGTIGVLLGKGDGSFAAAFTVSGDGLFPFTVVTSDFNGDNKDDLAATNYSGQGFGLIGLWLGKGNGQFGKASTQYTGGNSPYSLLTADFNLDGKSDIAVSNTNNGNPGVLGILLNDCGKPAFVAGFALVNTSNDQDVQVIKDGDTLDLSLLPSVRFNIRANTGPARVGSVVLQLSGTQNHKQVENGVPYALFKNENGNYFGRTINPGEYTLTATPYSQPNGKGAKGISLTIHFTVIYASAVTRFTVVNAENGEAIQELKEGDVLNLSAIPAQKISIRAITSPGKVGSVVFSLSGQQTHRQVENLAPYALYGGNTKTDNPLTPLGGNYTLTAAPYNAPGGKGAKGASYTVHFEVAPQSQGPCTTPSFAPPLTYASGSDNPQAIANADFNGDGKADLAFVHSNANTVGVLLSGSNGGFAQAAIYPSGGEAPRSVATGDFNKDGKPDLLVVNRGNFPSYAGAIGILLNKGGGQFLATATYPSGAPQPQQLVMADFNQDGNMDLAVANRGNFDSDEGNGNIGILLGKGDGSFAEVVTYFSGYRKPYCLAAGDFNGDGKTDLGVGHLQRLGYFDNDEPTERYIAFLRGNGDGSFAAAKNYFIASLDLSYDYLYTTAVIAGDFNGDGKTDLAATSTDSESEDGVPGVVSVRLGSGDGFAQNVSYEHRQGYPQGQYPSALLIDDFDANGKLDFITYGSGFFTIWLGKGDGGFLAPVTYAVNGNSVSNGDFNGDGVVDLAFADGGGVSVLLGKGDGSFAPAVFYANTSSATIAITTGDFNGDGSPDLATAGISTTTENKNIGVLLNNCPAAATHPNTFVKAGEKPLLEMTNKNGARLQGQPNPFAGNVIIQYTLPADAHVSIKIMDLLGRDVGTVFSGQRQAGTYTQEYNADKLSQGVYYCRMISTANGKGVVQAIKLAKAN